jgi:hypothetical protein
MGERGEGIGARKLPMRRDRGEDMQRCEKLVQWGRKKLDLGVNESANFDSALPPLVVFFVELQAILLN